MPNPLDDALARVSALRERLPAESDEGRRARLFSLLGSHLTEVVEAVALASDGNDSELTACFLALQATIVHCSRRTDLAAPLARILDHAMPPGRLLSSYLDPDVAAVFAETQLYRDRLQLPPGVKADATRLSRITGALHTALVGLPAELWRQTALAARTIDWPRGVPLLLVPPRTGQPVTPEARRPPAGSFPAWFAALTDGDTRVLDAAGERLWLDETLALLLRYSPSQVWLGLTPEASPDALLALAPLLGQVLPETPIAGLVAPGTPPAVTDALPGEWPQVSAATAAGVEALADWLEGGAVGEPPAVDVAEWPDPRRWPLPCYRQTAWDADLLLRSERHTGVQLAAALRMAHTAAPAVEVRVVGRTDAEQLAQMAAAAPRPLAPCWSIELAEPALSGDLAALAAAGMDHVALRVGPDAVPLAVAPAVIAALADLGLRLRARVAAVAADPALGEVIQALAAARAAVAVFDGPAAKVAQEAWARTTAG